MYVDLFEDVRTSCDDLRSRASGRNLKRSTSQGAGGKSLAFPFGIAGDSAWNRWLFAVESPGILRR
ncbi:MAG: hypothetical protein AB8I58_00425, partial [Anaerolineales bacterium]